MHQSGATQVFVRSLVLVGGGHSHVHVIKSLGMKPVEGVQVTLITKDVNTPYSGMLPAHIAGHYTKEDCHIDLQKLARFAGAQLLHTEAIGVDRARRLVHCKDGRPPIRYDVLSINVGSTPRFLDEQAPDDLYHVTRVKPIDSFSARWDAIVERVLARASSPPPAPAPAPAPAPPALDPRGSAGSRGAPEDEAPSAAAALAGTGPAEGEAVAEAGKGAVVATATAAVRLVVVGGGAGGVELALAMQHRLRSLVAGKGCDPDGVRVAMITRGTTLLTSHPRAVQKALHKVLTERKVSLYMGREVISVVETQDTAAPGEGRRPPLQTAEKEKEEKAMEEEEEQRGSSGAVCRGVLVCSDGSEVDFDEVIWCTHSGAAPWLRGTGLELSKSGFIKVDAFLQSVNTPGVFAAGDCADMADHPLPKAGVFAVRQGPPLTENLRRALEGRPLRPFVPQKHFLGIIGTGDRFAVASRGGWLSWLSLKGEAVWRWKDYIDVKWMRQYKELPLLDADETPDNPTGAADPRTWGGVPPNPPVKPAGRRGAHHPWPWPWPWSWGRGAPPPTPPPAAAVAAGPRALEAVAHASMRCGLCGSKVGSSVLSRVLTSLDVPGEGKPGPGPKPGGGGASGAEADGGTGSEGRTTQSSHSMRMDDAAVLPLPLPPPAGGGAAPTGATSGAIRTVHTVDFFRSSLADPYLFGRAAANHALSDAHAMGARATSALAVAIVPHGGEPQVEGQLEQLLAGCLRVLREEGCPLVGGHTCEGAELALGLTINGVGTDPAAAAAAAAQPGAVDGQEGEGGGGGGGTLGVGGEEGEGAPSGGTTPPATASLPELMRKGGARPGDALVLTKGLGTGAVMAADMRARADARWVAAATASMLRSSRRAAAVLRAHGATACTDVTGFGLAGHLAEMLRASPVPAAAAAAAAGGQEGQEEGADGGATSAPGPRALQAVEGGGGGGGGGCGRGIPRAEVVLGDVPLLPGAAECVGQGIVSSLQAQNERDSAGAVVACGAEAGEHRAFRLLFDPQTAGGLLASVPAARAASCVKALHDTGSCPDVAMIGVVQAPPSTASPLGQPPTGDRGGVDGGGSRVCEPLIRCVVAGGGGGGS